MNIDKIFNKTSFQDFFHYIGKSITAYSFNRESLLNSLQLQLFISFISLPFLIAWGLPVSLLSPFSTLIFGPFLTCFLLISSLIFFLELLYLPNSLLIWCLEKVTAVWIACLGLEQRAWLIAFCRPPLLIIVCIPLIALAIIHSKKITCKLTRIGYLACFLVITGVILRFFPHAPEPIETVVCNKGEITLISRDNALIMIDPGYLASRPSYESYIAYTLLPAIIQKTGKLQIDHVVVFTFNKRILDALHFLARKISIKNIYLPYWNGKIPSYAWQSYAQLKKTMIENSGKIHAISYKKQLYTDENSLLFLEPIVTKTISYYDATYVPLSVTGVIDKEKIVLYKKESKWMSH